MQCKIMDFKIIGWGFFGDKLIRSLLNFARENQVQNSFLESKRNLIYVIYNFLALVLYHFTSVTFIQSPYEFLSKFEKKL